MDSYVTGAVIRGLREQKKLTQAELAARLCVSDKTVSRWETGKGYPDVTLLEPLAAALGVSLTELFSGEAAVNANVPANVLRTKFYVCPVCGNLLTAMGEAAVSCHGLRLEPLEAGTPDEAHRVLIERIEDDYFVTVGHEMTKTHHLSFIAALSSDRLQLTKLYPEGPAEARFPIRGVRKILFCCNRDGLFDAGLPAKKK